MIARESRYTAPECFENLPTLESDVFSFGLILYELLTGQPGFDRDLTPFAVMKKIVDEKARPVIPGSVFPDAAQLIRDCWKQKRWRRPSFTEILARLEALEFKITAGVRSEKVREFVKAVKEQEKRLGIDIEDPE